MVIHGKQGREAVYGLIAGVLIDHIALSLALALRSSIGKVNLTKRFKIDTFCGSAAEGVELACGLRQ